MRKVILSAGHGGVDGGAAQNGYIERDLTIDFRRNLVTVLKNKYNIQAITDPDDYPLAKTLAWLKGKFGSRDILIDVHWNAGGGTGVEVIVPDKASAFEMGLAQALANGISDVTGWKKRSGGVKPESATARKRLGWMRPAAENILIEMCFIDNKTDMAVYAANKMLIVEKVASIIATFTKI